MPKDRSIDHVRVAADSFHSAFVSAVTAMLDTPDNLQRLQIAVGLAEVVQRFGKRGCLIRQLVENDLACKTGAAITAQRLLALTKARPIDASVEILHMCDAIELERKA